MSKKGLRIGQVFSLKLKTDDGNIERVSYEIECFEKHYVLCKKLSGGYRECILPHDLLLGSVIDKEQFFKYTSNDGCKVCEV